MSGRANGEGGLHRRRDGRWQGSLTVGYGPDGKQLQKYHYGKTRTEAMGKLSRALRDFEQGIVPVDENQTVTQFVDHWLEESVKPNVKPTTYWRHEQVVRLHIKPELGKIKLAKLAPQHVQSLLTKRLKGGLSPRSCQLIHTTLRCALNQALRWDLVPRNVAKLVKPPRGTSKRIEPLTPVEVRTFLDAREGERLEALFVLAVCSGLRLGELLGLSWEDVDLDRATLRVEHTLQRVDGVFSLGDPKTRQSRRTIPIPQMVVKALRAHKVRQAEERLLAGPDWDEWGDLVFTTDKGQPMNGCVVSHRFRKILAKGESRKQRFHDLRHCCATLLLSEGLNPKAVQEHLGHADVGITLNIYSHVLPEVREEAASRMDALLGGSSG